MDKAEVMRLMFYFFTGVLQDFLVTLNWRYVSKEKVIPAALFSFIVTIVSLLVLYNILSQLDGDRGIVAILVYAAGIATGTVLAMKARINH